MPSSSPGSPDSICVLDTNIILRIKHAIALKEQWQLLRYMDDLLFHGWLTYPKQVAKELADERHPDGPGIWAVGVQNLRQYTECSDDSLADVLGVAPGLFDPNEERNQADPYVVALAYELRSRHPDAYVCVATEDKKDRPPLISPASACRLLGIPVLDFQGFLDWLPKIDVGDGTRLPPT